MIKAVLLKPLDGMPEGAEREFDDVDFEALKRMGAVRLAEDIAALRLDGPTVEEYVVAGYRAENYPPQGYASRSTPEEIATAVASQAAPPSPEASAAKAAPAPPNKAAPPVANKSDSAPRGAKA